MPDVETGPGMGERRNKPQSVLLYNFNVGGAELKPEHKRFLQHSIVPILRAGSGLSIVGLTSRSGTTAANQALSERRAHHTLDWLQRTTAARFAAKEVVGVGEMKMKQEGYPDGSENPRFRSVILFVGPGRNHPRSPPSSTSRPRSASMS